MCRHNWRINMVNTNRNSLQTEGETQDVAEFVSEDGWGASNASIQKKQAVNDQKRGKVRRSIEEIKERRRLMELLGDDFDESDYLDS